MENYYNLTEVLDHIDPAELDYQEWINAGMALHHEDIPPASGTAGAQRTRHVTTGGSVNGSGPLSTGAVHP